MTDKIDGKECRYWFRPNPSDYRRCALRGKDDNCDEINDCFIKELLGKLAQKDEECKRLKEEIKTNGFGCFNIEMSEQLDQYKQTLTEIEDYCNKYPQNLIGFKKYILQKISECKQTKGNDKIEKENKYKQALDEIEKYLDAQQKYFDGEDYHNLLDIIDKVKDSK